MGAINVLVVTDTQIDFESGALGTAEAKQSVPYIIEKIREAGEAGHIILATKDTHEEDYLETNEGRHLPVTHCRRETKGWDFVSTIRSELNAYGAMSVLKDRFGSMDLPTLIKAFASESLELVVTEGKGITVTLIGWCTDICVITNALLIKTALPEAEVIVDSKCCAGVTPESHSAALTVMKSCQITVI